MIIADGIAKTATDATTRSPPSSSPPAGHALLSSFEFCSTSRCFNIDDDGFFPSVCYFFFHGSHAPPRSTDIIHPLACRSGGKLRPAAERSSRLFVGRPAAFPVCQKSHAGYARSSPVAESFRLSDPGPDVHASLLHECRPEPGPSQFTVFHQQSGSDAGKAAAAVDSFR